MCALPTAQLGQLGNMSMPYSIPTYEKGPGVLEKALAAFLVNAAGGVAQQGAQNVMSRDYAPEFGEEGAKGFGRLLGPKVNERSATQRRDQTFTREENERQRSATRSLENVRQAGDDRRLGVREKNEFQRTGMREVGDDRRMQTQIGANERIQKDNREAQLIETALRQFLQQSDPTNIAQGRYYDASADSLGAKADFTNSLRGVVGGRGQPGQSVPGGVAVTPAMRAEAEARRRSEARRALPFDQQIQDVMGQPQSQTGDPIQDLQLLLQQGMNSAEAPDVSTSSVTPVIDPRITAWLQSIGHNLPQ